MTQKPNAVLCRYGEVFLKKGRKQYFIEELRRNVAESLRSFPGVHVTAPYGRILVANGNSQDDNIPAFGDSQRDIERAVARVFGIESFSPGILCHRSIESIRDSAIAVVQNRRPGTQSPTSFKVETNRTDKTFPIRSQELSALIGAHILEQTPGIKVDVHHPAMTVDIEIRPEFVLVSAERFDGARGLPKGTSGRALLLLSGGIDSPVAGWLAMKRGVALEALYFHAFPYTSDQARRKVVELARTLTQWQDPFPLHIVQFANYQKLCRDHVRPKLLVLAYRRQMFRVAQAWASRRGLAALVTGESIGQVASQTLENLAAIESATTMTVLRPLCSYDKMETVALATRIGSYDISVQPYDDCCSLFVPEHPELHGRAERMDFVESKLNVSEHIDSILATIETITLTRD